MGLGETSFKKFLPSSFIIHILPRFPVASVLPRQRGFVGGVGFTEQLAGDVSSLVENRQPVAETSEAQSIPLCAAIPARCLISSRSSPRSMEGHIIAALEIKFETETP